MVTRKCICVVVVVAVVVGHDGHGVVDVNVYEHLDTHMYVSQDRNPSLTLTDNVIST